MQEIAQTLVQASTSADSRQRFPAAAAFVRESLMRQDPEGYARTCEALADAKAAAVERITAGTLLVTGDEDVVAPPQSVRAMAERLSAARAGPRTVVLSRCGHWTPIERPKNARASCASFLPAQR
jgi:pimeloyl-ACP methyl ester carboxylesterase